MNKKIFATILSLVLLLSGAALAEQADLERAEALKLYEETVLGGAALNEAERMAVSDLFDFFMALEAFEGRANDAVAMDSIDLKQIRVIEEEGDRLDEELDRYEDTLEASLRAGDFSRERFMLLEAEIERLDDQLEVAEDALEMYWDD